MLESCKYSILNYSNTLLHTNCCSQHTRETVVLLTVIEKIYYQNRGLHTQLKACTSFTDLLDEFQQGLELAALEVQHPLCLEVTQWYKSLRNNPQLTCFCSLFFQARSCIESV